MESKFLGSTGLAKFLENLYNVFSMVGHTHTKSQITDFPTIPSNVSQLTNDSGFVTAEQVTMIIPVDSTMSGTSENPVQNKVISEVINSINDRLEDVATEGYVDLAVASLVNLAPEALNTLDELAAALGDDENFAATITNQIAAKQDTITGTVGQFVVIGENGMITTKTIPHAEEATF